MQTRTIFKRAQLKSQAQADWRVQELLRALNEQILTLETVSQKITHIVGSPIQFYRYRDGSYFICE